MHVKSRRTGKEKKTVTDVTWEIRPIAEFSNLKHDLLKRIPQISMTASVTANYSEHKRKTGKGIFELLFALANGIFKSKYLD